MFKQELLEMLSGLNGMFVKGRRGGQGGTFRVNDIKSAISIYVDNEHTGNINETGKHKKKGFPFLRVVGGGSVGDVSGSSGLSSDFKGELAVFGSSDACRPCGDDAAHLVVRKERPELPRERKISSVLHLLFGQFG